MSDIRLSVVTPTFNRRAMLKEAIESVLAQRVDGVEHIIIDAKSTDGTDELLRSYSHLTVVSEPDAGIYDGMNKGLDLAKGDVLVLLNSDDLLATDALRSWLSVFEAYPDAEMVSGCAQLVRLEDGALIEDYCGPANRSLTVEDSLLGLPIINARGFRKSLWRKIGPFDLRFPTTADRDWLVRAAVAATRNVSLDQVVYRYRAHAGSATFDKQARRAKRLASALESMDLARHVRGATGEASIRRAARVLHDKSAARACSLALSMGQWGSAVEASKRALWCNPAWIFSVAALAIARGLGLEQVERRLEGRSIQDGQDALEASLR